MYVREFGHMVLDSHQVRTRDGGTDYAQLDDHGEGVWLTVENAVGNARITTSMELSISDIRRLGAWLKGNLDAFEESQNSV